MNLTQKHLDTIKEMYRLSKKYGIEGEPVWHRYIKGGATEIRWGAGLDRWVANGTNEYYWAHRKIMDNPKVSMSPITLTKEQQQYVENSMKKEREFRVGDKVMCEGGEHLVADIGYRENEVYLLQLGWRYCSDCTLIPTHADVVEAFEGSGYKNLQWDVEDGYRYIDDDTICWHPEIIDAYRHLMSHQIDKEALKAEKAELEKKLAEINEKLGE
jgi:hypothetical protein